MAASTTEQRELALVDKVELRIALASTDDKLSMLLKTYLPPLLLKLGSEHLSVRNKVIGICQHLNTRLQSLSVELPVAALLKQFKEQDAKLIKHFDLLYAQQGFKRLSGKEKHDLVPELITGISAVVKDATDQSGAQFFNLFLQSLHNYEFPRKGSKDEDELRKTWGLSDKDAKVLSSWFEKLVLLEIIRPSAPSQAEQMATAMSDTHAPSSLLQSKGLPGITEDERIFLSVFARPGVWDPSTSGGMSMKATKLLVLKLLSTGAFNDQDRFMPALLASAYRDSNIADRGEDLLKHAIADVDVNDTAFIRRLFDVYHGTEGRAAASPPLQIKILGVLQRSAVSATSFPADCLRIVEQGISGALAGREAAKLHTAVFSFANFFLRDGKKTDLRQATPQIISLMQQYIQVDQGWPSPKNKEQDMTLRGNAYEMIGTCAKAGGVEDISLLDWLFRSLSDDTSGRDISLAIEHALAKTIDTFSFIYKDETSEQLEDGDTTMTDGVKATANDLSELLYRYVEEDGSAADASRRSTRYIAARFANRCLPYSDTIGRWIDILAAGGSPNEKMEVVEEGKKGLDPYWFSMLNSDRKDLWAKPSGSDAQPKVLFPSFVGTFTQIFSLNVLTAPDETFAGFQKRYPHAISTALSFCWRILVSEALEFKGEVLPVDAEWGRRIENGAKQDLGIRSALKDYIKHVQSNGDDSYNAFRGFISLCFEAVQWKDGAGIIGSHELLVQALSICPESFASPSNVNLQGILPSLKANDQVVRGVAAQVFGIVAITSPTASLIPILEQLIRVTEGYKDAIGAGINVVNGAMKALAHALARASYAKHAWAEAMLQLIQRLNSTASMILESSHDQTLLEAAYVVVEQLSIFSVYEQRLQMEAKAIRLIIDQAFEKAKAGNEKAVKVLGRFGLSVAETGSEEDELNYLEEKLYKLHEIRELGAQFAVGEALCCTSCGWETTALQLDMDVDLPIPKNMKSRTLSRILQQTIKNCRASKPALRKASVIWLLCLVQFCGHLPEVQEQLRACQAAFGNSLSERDDLVQEAASRGLGLVYEKGDRSLRDRLVRDLMQSFSSDKSNLGGGNVDEETTLFDPGALRTGDGDNSITTYKDILSLASEIGNPGLVYQFMSLAANNAVWSNRAAFANSGLRNILSDSSVGGYLSENPKLYTKLFRYRFDPNTNVQRSMTDIWNSLVKDSSATIEKYFDPIMEDLLGSILTKEWRVRQACCAALSDLVQGRPLERYEKYLTDIWGKCFKVLDDIKESVRTAAQKLARVLSQILVRNLEAGETSTKSAEGMLKHVLPFLLSSSGLDSSAQEVQLLSLKTILDVVKKARPEALRPFIPELVERMLALFTDLEDQMVNYLHLNAAQYKISEGAIDSARLNAVRNHPLMEAIDRCYDLLDTETMEKTALSIERAMKAAVGLPTKLACGNTLVSLTLRHRELFRPHAGKFLRSLEKCSLDRNETASSTYAASTGYLCKLATDKQIMRLVNYAKKLWLEDEDEKHRAVSADIIRSISKQVSDRFASLASEILPFVFVAKHDGQEGIKDLNTKTWEDNVGASAASLYLQEIMTLCLDLMDSPKWNLKHSAARSVADATTILAAGYDGIAEDQAEVIWPALKKALDGKTWEGKEVVIDAFAKFADKIRPGALKRKIAPEVAKVCSLIDMSTHMLLTDADRHT